MKTKTIDCIKMKRAGAADTYRRTKDMTFQQKVAFWRKESAALRREHAAAIKKANAT